MLNKLSTFKIPVQIQVDRFFHGKELEIARVKINKDGLVVLELAITKDDTDYGDPSVSNIYEKFNFVITNSNEKDLNKYPLRKKVKIVKVDKATVYGEYQNNLSISGAINIVNE